MRYKPDPFYHTAHSAPPPLYRLFYELDAQLSQSQSSNDSYSAVTPSGGENLSAFSLSVFYVGDPPNFIWESGQ